MKITNICNRYTLLTTLLCLVTNPVAAAEIAISETPLFLQTSAEANVFFLYDDSGSMRSNAMTMDAVSDTRGSQIKNGGSYYDNVFGTGVATDNNPIDFSAEFNSAGPVYGTGTVRNLGDVAPYSVTHGRAAQYNKLYYDPTRTYEPWEGKLAYPATAAPVNPDDPTGVKAKLTVNWPRPGGGGTYNPMSYWTWNDADSDGNVDAGEVTGPTTIDPTSAADAAQRQNFSNWFTYHRSREFEAKYAMGKTIMEVPEKTRLRIGFASLRSASDTAMTSITTLDNTDIADPGVIQRVTVREAIYGLASDDGTPLRQTYQSVGNYFACSGTTPFGTSACAIQTTPLVAGDEPPGSCQQNFAVVVTDGVDTVGHTPNPTASGTADNTLDTTFNKAPYVSSSSNGMADLAMYYYERDLDGDNTNNLVPTICGVDENPGQHLVTYALSFGIPPTISAPTTHPFTNQAPLNCQPATTGSTHTWNDNPGGTVSNKINDLLHATYNGRGKFYNADEPEKLLAGLKDVLSDVAKRRGAASAVGLSSTVNDTATRVYVASFNSGGWYGELQAYTIGAGGTFPADTNWGGGAHAKLNVVNREDSRVIVTYHPNAGTANGTYGFGRPFKSDATNWGLLPTQIINDLKTDKTGATESDAIGKDRLEYLRGEHDCEAGNSFPGADCNATTYGFRPRYIGGSTNQFRLGDIVNSSPLYVGEPRGSYPENSPFPTGADAYSNYVSGANYTAFQTVGKHAANRKPMLYVGANDGMLHAFDATNGEEIFAYVPLALAANTTEDGLHKLTEDGAHKSYVDLTPSVYDAYTSTPQSATSAWRTVLVGGLRSGGRGIYALDITDPDSMTTDAGAAKRVMWEFSEATLSASDFANLGDTFSRPIVAPFRTALNAIKWFAVFGNGYNSENGHAVLYLLDLAGPGGDGVWQEGSEYYMIDTAVGVAPASGTPNGLSTPAVIDSDADGIFDRAYAGDLYGNMWAFNLSGNTPDTDWDVAFNSGTKKPLFVTAGITSPITTPGTGQPITAKPTIIRNRPIATDTNTAPNVLVLFGTGSYLSDGDVTDTSQQTMYGIWDEGEVLSRAGTNFPIKQQTLAAGLTATQRAISLADTFVYGTATGDYHGWYFDLPDSGERMITSPVLFGTTMFYVTVVPTSAPCGGGGYSWLMAMNPYTGVSPDITALDTNNDGAITPLGDNTITNLPDAGKQIDFNLGGLAIVVNDPNDPPGPCAAGTGGIGLGTSSSGNVSGENLCGGGGNAKTGRYSWRQLRFE